MKSNSLALTDFVVMRDGAPLTGPLSLTLNAGEMLVLRGNNGSGKSTLLKMVAGLLPAGSGTLHVNGQWPAFHAPCYLGHKNGLAPTMNVKNNVAIWAKLSGFPELIAPAMHYFELDDVADVVVGKLSAGWQQRVALTRLITMQAALWLLDEPTANLDVTGIQLLQSLMQVRLEQGGMIVIATHADLQGEMIKNINISDLNSNFHVKATYVDHLSI